MKYTEPAKDGYEQYTDWEAVVREFQQHPNTELVLKVDKYRNCSRSTAAYAVKKLRSYGLQARKVQHYDEFPNTPDPATGEPTTVRKPLGTYSIHGTWVQS